MDGPPPTCGSTRRGCLAIRISDARQPTADRPAKLRPRRAEDGTRHKHHVQREPRARDNRAERPRARRPARAGPTDRTGLAEPAAPADPPSDRIPPAAPAYRPRRAVRPADRGFDPNPTDPVRRVATTRSRTISTTVAGGSSRPSPHD